MNQSHSLRNPKYTSIQVYKPNTPVSETQILPLLIMIINFKYLDKESSYVLWKTCHVFQRIPNHM